MNPSFPAGGFGTGPFPGDLWQAMERLKSAFEQRISAPGGPGAPAAPGPQSEVRAAVLALLSEQPMHGQEILREIEERTAGKWQPGAGAVYPTLQLLADEGLVSAAETEGRRTYSLTDSGRAEAEAAAPGDVPWDGTEPGQRPRFTAVPKAGVELAQAAAQVNRTGTPEQIEQAVAVLDEARRKLHAILAQD